MQRHVQPQPIPCYPVVDGQLGDALAGRLLIHAGGKESDDCDQDAPYRDGFTAGVCWAQELATLENLDHLDEVDRELCLVAPSWVRGFVDGALTARRNPGDEPPRLHHGT